MKSLIIGIVRPGTTSDFVLNTDTKYVSLCGTKPEVSFSIDCGQYKFLELINGLRYQDADPSTAEQPISALQELVTGVFERMKYLQIEEEDTELHIRLVTTPLELAQLPFEFVLAPVSIADNPRAPLLTLPGKLITLTREVRQEWDVQYTWPSQPRVLFAWAEPGGDDIKVPHDTHEAILKSIVSPMARPLADKPYPEPDWQRLLTEVPNASVQTLKEALATGIAEGHPYTHVHILAHGGVKDKFGLREFQLILCKEGAPNDQQKINGQQLSDALIPEDGRNIPTVVSLSVCDSGNTGNPILPSGSLIYQLHTAGLPCVFASQFPLTMSGSATLVKVLYGQLLNACDPRRALYETRRALKDEPSHDWASLVAYARFPDDINEQLIGARLKTLFGSMKVANAWVDHVFRYWSSLENEQKKSALRELDERLSKSIDALSTLLVGGKGFNSALSTASLQAEHLGLLGSAYKRKGEYLFRLIEWQPEQRDLLIDQSAEALNMAKQYYYSGLDADPASHWTAMQYLSLKAVTEGTIKDDIEHWYVIKNAAERDERKATSEEDKIWAWGTLAELYLLQALTREAPADIGLETAIAKAQEYLKKMAAADANYNGAKESTARQLERYINWWPLILSSAYPSWLKNAATQVRNVLPTLQELLPTN